ncbi:MAG: cupin domain-containing protein [Anaerovoracaceae bacterium]
MIEQVYEMSTEDEKAVERVIQDENIHYIHMVFNKDEGLPEHFSNSNVYMTVVRGTLSIGLNDQEVHQYNKGTLLKIPVNTKMNVKNVLENVLELIVVKAPAPLKQ